MIWKDIEAHFDGKSIRVKPTIEFMNYIEKRNYSIANVLTRLVSDTVPISWVSCLVADTFTYAGYKITPEEVMEKSGGINAELITIAAKIVASCLPQVTEDKSVKKKQLKKQE